MRLFLYKYDNTSEHVKIGNRKVMPMLLRNKIDIIAEITCNEIDRQTTKLRS